VPHAWIWPAFPHVDPQKEAAAQAIRLANMTTTYAAEFAADGLDYKTAFTQLAREKKLMQELGLSTAPQPPGSAPATDQPPPDDEEIPDDQAEADEAEADDDDDEDENDVD
jgi:capsid protein